MTDELKLNLGYFECAVLCESAEEATPKLTRDTVVIGALLQHIEIALRMARGEHALEGSTWHGGLDEGNVGFGNGQGDTHFVIFDRTAVLAFACDLGDEGFEDRDEGLPAGLRPLWSRALETMAGMECPIEGASAVFWVDDSGAGGCALGRDDYAASRILALTTARGRRETDETDLIFALASRALRGPTTLTQHEISIIEEGAEEPSQEGREHANEALAAVGISCPAWSAVDAGCS